MDKIVERRILRLKVLKELFDFYFNSNGLGLRLSTEEYNQDVDRKLACEYLLDKNLIKREFIGGNFIDLRITAYGIDEIETKEQYALNEF